MEKTVNRSGFKMALLRIKENRIISNLLPVLLLLFLIGLFHVLTGGKFNTAITWKSIIKEAVVIGCVATGAAFIFATGNVNIAMGSCTALTCTVTAKLFEATGSVPLMIVFAIAFAMMLLYICAMLSTVLHVKVMFVTIVAMVLLSNLHETLLGGVNLVLNFSTIRALQKSGISYWIFGIYLAFSIVIFHFTKIGRSIKMVGSNSVCAEQTGIFRDKYLTIAFLIAGIGVGCGAVLFLIRSGSVSSSSCGDMNMNCMLAIVLGGMPVFGGGKSKAYAAIIGVLIVSVLNTGLIMIGVSTQVLQGIRGLVFIFLVLLGNERTKLLPTREG